MGVGREGEEVSGHRMESWHGGRFHRRKFQDHVLFT